MNLILFPEIILKTKKTQFLIHDEAQNTMLFVKHKPSKHV